ncbi:MAG TPA: hypothetical protein VFE82_11205 [Ramlibacter sp.]|jgi:hypothetical protein|uniref:hypothetical protein n=1 Tax=Ramlibacter sp. TaxID=1917967 RepID=UPI002D71C468|nr:hypothetical protein [Ramlibacter sp.]HZY19041.1 hypothetical protein [Ramlibacter sp.]
MSARRDGRFRAGPTALLVAVATAAGCSHAPPVPVGRCALRPAGAAACLQGPPAAATVLPAGERTVRVDALCEWNGTGVLLEPGGRYDLTVAEVLEPWVDWWVPSDLATGWRGIARWSAPLAQRRARAPGLPIYSLVGSEGPSTATAFAVGWSARLVATQPQELLLFANDWWGRYGNNQGCLDVRIRRVP